MEGYFTENNPSMTCQGIQHITKYKNNCECRCVTGRGPEPFLGRFEAVNPTATTPHPSASSSSTITLQEHEVRRMLRTVNPRKAAGPKGVLRARTDQLTVLPVTSHHSLLPEISYNHPSPQKADNQQPQWLQAYCPHALRDLSRTIYAWPLPVCMATEVGITIVLHTALSSGTMRGGCSLTIAQLSTQLSWTLWLKNPPILGRPHTSADGLNNLPQTSRNSSHFSLTITVPTRLCTEPSAVLTVHTHTCTPAHLSNSIIKLADDTTVVGLISRGDESAYRDEVVKPAGTLNITKTTELILAETTQTWPPILINGKSVERVHTFKLLGIHIAIHDLSRTANTTVRVLRKNNRATVESILVDCITARWVHREWSTRPRRSLVAQECNTTVTLIMCKHTTLLSNNISYFFIQF